MTLTALRSRSKPRSARRRFPDNQREAPPSSRRGFGHPAGAGRLFREGHTVCSGRSRVQFRIFTGGPSQPESSIPNGGAGRGSAFPSEPRRHAGWSDFHLEPSLLYESFAMRGQPSSASRPFAQATKQCFTRPPRLSTTHAYPCVHELNRAPPWPYLIRPSGAHPVTRQPDAELEIQGRA